MSKIKAKVKVKSGAPQSGSKIASQKVIVVKTNGKPRVTGQEIYKSKVQLNTHMERGKRPAKIEFRRVN